MYRIKVFKSNNGKDILSSTWLTANGCITEFQNEWEAVRFSDVLNRSHRKHDIFYCVTKFDSTHTRNLST